MSRLLVEGECDTSSWSVEIFKIDTDGFFDWICDGTLISSNLVVSSNYICIIYLYINMEKYNF